MECRKENGRSQKLFSFQKGTENLPCVSSSILSIVYLKRINLKLTALYLLVVFKTVQSPWRCTDWFWSLDICIRFCPSLWLILPSVFLLSFYDFFIACTQKLYYQSCIFPLTDYGSNIRGTTSNMNIERLKSRSNHLKGYSELIIFPIELHSDSTLFGA